MNILNFNNFYLVGIKGVAMTGMANMLIDAGKSVQGSDVNEDFVTSKQLNQLGLEIQDFSSPLPAQIDCLIYTAAHGGETHPQVQAAQSRGIITMSHAQALADFFNQKKGIAVCGVGGKSTISAMIAWIFEKTQQPISYSVGVGEIIDLDKSATWNNQADWMVAEADEYATNPNQVLQGEQLIPRFSFLKPQITVCSQIMFDHPDVYQNEQHTHQVFSDFFQQIKPDGIIIMHQSSAMLGLPHTAETKLTYGSNPTCDAVVNLTPSSSESTNVGQLLIGSEQHKLQIRLPGKYNLENAAAAILAAREAGISISESIEALKSFQSTSRRFEFKGQKNGVLYYDDYAHHPMEIAAVLAALRESFPTKKCVVAFQPHTFSRTKDLLAEFAVTLANSPELVLLDIFASAREKDRGDISSDKLVEAIQKQNPNLSVTNLHSINNLAAYCQKLLSAGDLFISLGAGDIYKVHDLI